MTKTITLPVLALMLSACTNIMQPHYSRSYLGPVQVQRVSENEISLRYTIPMESYYFSKGVNYEVVGDTLKVYVDRTSIKNKREPMLESTMINPPRSWDAVVHIPYREETVIMVYTDGEEQIYP